MFCSAYNALVDGVCVASARYHEATSTLVLLAGSKKAASLADAKRDCRIRLEDCRRTKEALTAHKRAHGCCP